MFLSAMSLKFFIFELFALVWSYLCDLKSIIINFFGGHMIGALEGGEGRK